MYQLQRNAAQKSRGDSRGQLFDFLVKRHVAFCDVRNGLRQFASILMTTLTAPPPAVSGAESSTTASAQASGSGAARPYDPVRDKDTQ